MFSNDKKSGSGGGVSNWFSSLRRQPKKQKSLDSNKLLQKSCVDLTNVASTSEQDLLYRLKPSSKLKPTSNNNNNNETSSVNLCTNCCCKFSSKNSSTSIATVSPILSDDDDEHIEQIDQLRKVLISNEDNYTSAGSTTTTTTNNNFSTNLLLYNKKEEFSRTTRTITTKITKTTIVNANGSTINDSTSSISQNRNLHHRIGLVFNEQGQLINRKQLLNVKNRGGLVFDENGKLMANSGSNSDATTPLTRASSILDDSTIEFIDSSVFNSDIYNRANLEHKCNCSNKSSSAVLSNSSSIISNIKSDDWSSDKQVYSQNLIV